MDAIGNEASERGCVVVLLDVPGGHGNRTAWEGAISAAGKSAHGSAVTGDRSQLTRIIVTLVTLGSGFHQHVDDAGQVSVSPLLASLFVHWQRTSGRELPAKPGKFLFRFVLFHPTRLNEVLQHLRAMQEVAA